MLFTNIQETNRKKKRKRLHKMLNNKTYLYMENYQIKMINLSL